MKELVEELFPKVRQRVGQYLPVMIETADELHSNPEASFEEAYACDYLTSLLRRFGFSVEIGTGGLATAFEASLRWGSSGPAVGIIVEYDALPEMGHACGHNLFAATSIGAALVLADYLVCYDVGSGGELRVIGTPAEEKGGGKCVMADRGVFDDLDVVLGIHPDQASGVGGSCLALSQYYVCFHGTAAHASDNPERGSNALNAVIATFNNVNALRQHLRDDARIHGVIVHGGVAANIVPDYAEAEFLLRSADEEYQAELVEKFRHCAEGAAMSAGVKLKLKQIRVPYQATRSNAVLQQLFRECFEFLDEPLDTSSPKISGSSDVGNVSRVLPAIQASCALGSGEVSLHTREFAQLAGSAERETYLFRASSVLSAAALCCFVDAEIVYRAWEDFHNAERMAHGNLP
ncbi:MAG: M20 family metallopeptidase [Bacillota bacterium]